MDDKLEPVDFESSLNVRLPDHELLLSFVNDSGAEKFMDWWYCLGEASFNEYCESVGG